MFNNCTNLLNVTMYNKIIAINRYGFYNCTSLE